MIRINLTLQGGRNHTTYEHPRGLVWQPFTSSFTRCATSTPTQDVCAYLLTPGGEPAAFRPDHQFLALSEGGASSVGVRRFKSVKYCMLRRFTEPHKHGMWLVLFNSWFKGQPQTGLNRHRRGYTTKEAGSAVHLSVSGPIGLARSQIF